MKIQINRAPVLTLWAATVAERMGHPWETALTLGKVMAGLNAQAKGRTLGIYTARERGEAERKKANEGVQWITVCGKAVPARQTDQGLRAVTGESAIDPASVQTYLEKAFGESLPGARAAMKELAGAFPAAELQQRAFGLYEKFRPTVAKGAGGWGQKGELDLDLVRSLSGRPGTPGRSSP